MTVQGYEPPLGSKVIASGEYEEYRIDVILGVNGKMYAQLYQKKYAADGSPIRFRMYDRANQLATENGRPPIDLWSFVG